MRKFTRKIEINVASKIFIHNRKQERRKSANTQQKEGNFPK